MRFFHSISALLLSISAVKAQSSNLTGADPIPLYDLPTLVPGSSFVADPFDVEAIRNTLAHYPLAIDGKKFAALDLVFTTYSAPLNVLTPLSTIESSLESSLAPVTTQHLFGTQVIDILSENSAFSVTYYTATHFGKGVWEGQIAVAYGQYQDVWIRQPASGWRISHRNLVYMVSESFVIWVEPL